MNRKRHRHRNRQRCVCCWSLALNNEGLGVCISEIVLHKKKMYGQWGESPLPHLLPTPFSCHTTPSFARDDALAPLLQPVPSTAPPDRLFDSSTPACSGYAAQIGAPGYLALQALTSTLQPPPDDLHAHLLSKLTGQDMALVNASNSSMVNTTTSAPVAGLH